jgi:hypothetical protein
VYRSNEAAARRALEDDAPVEACRFFEVALGAAHRAGIRVSPAFEGAWGEASLRANRHVDATRHFERGVALSTDNIERGILRARLAFVHTSAFDATSAWAECVAAFEDLGVSVTRFRLIKTLRDWGRGLLASRPSELTRGAAGRRRRRLAALASVYQIAQVTAYYDMNALNWMQLALRALYPAQLIGPSRELVLAYTAYSFGMASVQLRSVAEEYARRAIEVAEREDHPQLVAFAMVARALSVSLCGESARSVDLMRRAMNEHGHWLDGVDYVNALGDLTWNLSIRGYVTEAWESHSALLARLGATTARQGVAEGHAVLSQKLTVCAVLGKLPDALSYLEHADRLAAKMPKNRFHTAFVSCNLVCHHRELGELGAPLEQAIAQFHRVRPPPRLTIHHLRCFYVYQAYARLDQCERSNHSTRADALERLAESIRELTHVANIQLFECHLRAAQCGYERLRGRFDRARRRAAEAASLAAAVDSPWAAFEGLRQEWLLLRQVGDPAAESKRRHALELAHRHGWISREQRVRGTAEPYTQRASAERKPSVAAVE